MTIPEIRIGEGWDVHALVSGRPLIIGGVQIPFDRGLQGHSDADVLLHAMTDALLGGAALGDIGMHFPDTDARFKGADSVVLLREAAARVAQAGWRIGNIDSTVIAQAPKLMPWIPGTCANRLCNASFRPQPKLSFACGSMSGYEHCALRWLNVAS